MNIIKVSSKSAPQKIAGAIANTLKTESKLEVHSVGAGALNQAIKGIIIARGFLAPSGKNLVCIPSFEDVKINGEEKTAIKLIIESL